MSFGGMPPWQAWLLVLSVALGAWLVFRIKIRPRRVGVPSILFWQRLLLESPTWSHWERLRRVVSLAITILIAAALAAAFTNPRRGARTGSPHRMLVVLDSSWSMLAKRPDGSTRWQMAVAEAKRLVQSAASDELALATTAEGLVQGPTGDRSLIAAALDRLAPQGDGTAEWPQLAGIDSTHFFTDGGARYAHPPDVTVHSVFAPAPNVAITAFSARTALSATARAEAYLEVGNFAETAQRVHLTVTRDAAVLIDRDVSMAAGEVSKQTLYLDQPGGARLRAHVTAQQDALAIDDDAVAWFGAGAPASVTVVSDAPAAWERLLREDSSIRVTAVAPSAFQPTDADVVLFDRWLPATAPGTPALIVAPPAATWLGQPGANELAPRWHAAAAHAVLQGMDPMTLEIERARRYDAPTLVPIATSAHGTPLVSIEDSRDRRFVVLGFTGADSNFSGSPAFPVLVGNALDWLAHPIASEPVRPGAIAVPASTSRISAADGAPVPVIHMGDRAIATLRTPGFYLVEAGGSHSVIAVNAGRAELANLSHSTLWDTRTANGGRPFAGRPWWTYAVALAFGLATIEWITWQRRITV